MNRGKEPIVSLCEKRFILEAIKESKRVDGREIYDYRELTISLGKNPGHVEVTLGRTRVLARVSSQVVQPKPQRPTEGILYFNVELSPMASPSFEVGKQSNLAIAITRILERCQRESRALDTESLCIIAGHKVWEIRIDLHVLDHCGNLIDCASVASITALKHFRRPDVTVVGEEATIHPFSEREPVPLSVHHMPICFTFAFFWDGEFMVVDPSLEEEQAMEGKLVVGMNVHKEVCVLQIMGGVALLPDQVMRCTQIANVKCVEVTEMIKNALEGKSLNRLEFESILRSKREKEEIPRDFTSDQDMEEDEKKDEVMEVEEPTRKDEVHFLGPGTAELVGLGGKSTWEVLDSISGDESGEEETASGKPKSKPSSPPPRAAAAATRGKEAINMEDSEEVLLLSTAMTQRKEESQEKKVVTIDDDSEEEETLLLTTPDVAVVAHTPNRAQQQPVKQAKTADKTRTNGAAPKSKRAKKRARAAAGKQ